VEDEEAEGVWGYLVPLDGKTSQYETLVLKDRRACPQTLGKQGETKVVPVQKYTKQEEDFEESKIKKLPSQGYLIGRHPECGMFPMVHLCCI
jgi:serine/threonine-protein kinase Chk2